MHFRQCSCPKMLIELLGRVLASFWHNLMITLIKAVRRSALLHRSTFKFSGQADPYYILGVDKTASFIDIKKAFYKLASEFHPDKNSSQVQIPTNPVSTAEVRHHQASI